MEVEKCFSAILISIVDFFLLRVFCINDASTKVVVQYSEDNPNRYWSPEKSVYTSRFLQH